MQFRSMMFLLAGPILAGSIAVRPAAATTVVVTSPSGLFTNSGPSNAAGPGAAFDTWFANNVRAGGSAGITASQPISGTGSIEFSGPTNAKADFEYYFSSANQFALSSLNALSYDYYRSSGSTAAAYYMPALRLYVTDGSRSGYLVFEGIYNGQPTATTDAVQAENVIGAKFWATGSLPDAFSNYDRTLADWSALLPNLRVTALSTGIGSGWNGSYAGAVDNITYGLANAEATTFNFEVAVTAVPEPTTLALLGGGLIGLAALRRRSAG